MEKRLNVALRKVTAFLEKENYRYAIIGGIAMAQWGYVRATYDIDIKVLVPKSDYETVAKTIRQAFPKSGRENLPHNPLIVSVVIDDVIVDFLLALPGYEEQIIERAVGRELGGHPVWICSAEDLIIQKAVADRPRDWPDIEALLMEQVDQLNEDYLENWLSQFSGALEKPEILSQYMQLLQKVKRLKSSHE